MSGVRRMPSAEADSLRSKSRSSSIPAALDDAAKLQLAPLAADVGRAERLHEPSGLGLQRLLRQVQRSQLLGERRGRSPRSRSTCCSLASACFRDSLSGCTRSSIAFWRPSRSSLAVCWNSDSEVFASARNDWLFWRRASDDSAEKASRSFDSASCSSASLAPRCSALGLQFGAEPRAILLRRSRAPACSRACAASRAASWPWVCAIAERAKPQTATATTRPSATPAAKRAIEKMSTSRRSLGESRRRSSSSCLPRTRSPAAANLRL